MAAPIQRDLPAAVVAETEIDFTRPVYLVKLLFPSQTRFVSSNIQIDYNGDTYLEGQVSVGSFQWDADGNQRGTIILSNEANSASALVLNGTVNDIEVEIFKTYLIAAGGNTDPQFYVKGSLDGASVSPKEAVINVVTTTAGTAFVPTRYHTPAEGFNWLPVGGEVITWGEETFELKAAP